MQKIERFFYKIFAYNAKKLLTLYGNAGSILTVACHAILREVGKEMKINMLRWIVHYALGHVVSKELALSKDGIMSGFFFILSHNMRILY